MGRLYPRLYSVLGRYQVAFREASYALYEYVDVSGAALRVTAALPVPESMTITDDGVTTVVCPAFWWARGMTSDAATALVG